MSAPTATEPARLLPGDLGERIEAATGGRLASVKPRGGGGASRQGAEVVLLYPDGREQSAYLSHDIGHTGAGDDAGFAREVAVLRAFAGPLSGHGVAVAPFLAAIADSRAILTGLVAGRPDFGALISPADRSAVGSDYMRQLALLHHIDVERHPIEGFGTPKPAAETVRETLAWLRTRDREQGSDTLTLLVLDWLDAHVPAEPDRIVLVHGDAGPANFLFEDTHVSALLDWELVHYGDPMADLAMICLRTLFQPFIPLPEAFAAYEAAGGAKVDLDRIRYYRLLLQLRFSGNAPPVRHTMQDLPASAFGLRFLTMAIHRKVMAETLADLEGIALPLVDLPDCPPGPCHQSFQVALGEIRDGIAPRLSDEQAIYGAGNLARMVKWWRNVDRHGAAYDDRELGELGRALGERVVSIPQGRAALAQALAAGTIGKANALRLCHARATREHALLGDAMGALAGNQFQPLA